MGKMLMDMWEACSPHKDCSYACLDQAICPGLLPNSYLWLYLATHALAAGWCALAKTLTYLTDEEHVETGEKGALYISGF